MDKIEKALKKLGSKERQAVKSILSALQIHNFVGLDVQKLSWHKDIFRIRKGSIRIIYRENNGAIFILAIERRSEKTYRKF